MNGETTERAAVGRQNGTAPPSPRPRSEPARAAGPSDATGPIAPVRPRPTRHAIRPLIPLAALVVLLGGVGGAIAAFVLPPTYVAQTDIAYPLDADRPTGALLRDDRALTTQVVLIGSPSVLGPVAARTGMTYEELTDKVSATVVEGSEVIRVEVRDGSRQRGVDLAAAVSRTYFDLSTPGPPSRAQTYLQTQLDDVTAQIGGRAAGPPASSDQTVASSLVERQRDLQRQIDDLRLAEINAPQPRVLVAPYSLPDPAGIGPVLSILSGILVGLMAAVALVAVLLRRRSWS